MTWWPELDKDIKIMKAMFLLCDLDEPSQWKQLQDEEEQERYQWQNFNGLTEMVRI